MHGRSHGNFFICFEDFQQQCFLYQQGNFLPSSLCRQHQEKLEELARLEENLRQETQAKENRNLQIVELEQTLAKESQRASDLKVTREIHCVLHMPCPFTGSKMF